MEKKEKAIRTFSVAFKKEKVGQIDAGKISILQLSRIYEVSPTAIYKWIRKYSKFAGRGEKVVVQKESEQAKTELLLKRFAELEHLVDQKQVKVEYL